MSSNLLVELGRLFRLRNRVVEGVLHDVRQRYVGSVFGIAWAALFPLLQLGVYAGLYTFIFKVRPSGFEQSQYVILVFSGLVPLMAFNEAVTSATGSLTANKNLLMNTVFPAELIPLRAALAAQVPGLFGLTITMVAGFLFGYTGWQAIVLVPLFWLLLFMFAMGVGWLLSLLSLVARDIQYGMGIVLMMLMVLSPFAYTPEMVPSALKAIIYFNPMSYFVLCFQQAICYGHMPDLINVLGCLILASTSFFVGFALFQRAKRMFFDYV
ncbi:hypothetical protein FE236_07890 [Mariprofundus erugo]|uniref:ABC transporter permease n=1 Tax=Mariprofundus erugo TaxID=2528639 RepID=UPI0010FD9457|nr:ABC transporter permease [Mariprofundus erugo]TLS76045.1 hypothetical protein FE236_07890 [Mariprofundus erugo]